VKAVALVICLFLVSGCASLRDRIASMHDTQGKDATFILKGISDSDSTEISQDIAQYMANQYPAAKTTIELDVVNNLLHKKLQEQLTRRGFGIGASPEAVQLRYYVTALDTGLLVRMRYQYKVASRYYPRATDGRLSMQSRFTVREATK
jgi:uncharacterized lipoprotein YajG